MKAKWLYALLAIIFAFGSAAVSFAAPQALCTACAAVLMDAQTTRVLAAQNAHARLPMASTTKIMTALLALEISKLNELVTVPKEAYGKEGSSIYLNLGEKMTMEDLLYGLMLASGNDAAIAIAVHLGGSIEGFAEQMNARATALGCTNTHFVTPNGLHDAEHYSSAYDMALIASAAMKHPLFRTIVNTKYRQTTSGDVVRTFKNKNKLLWQYEGGNGIKTGFTKASGRCLVFSAERDGKTIVGAVLNAPDMWNASKDLLDYGFKAYTWRKFVSSSEALCTVKIDKGVEPILEILPEEDILIPLRNEEAADAVTLKVACPKTLPAPVKKGQQVGKIEAWCDGRLLACVSLSAAETVMRKEYPYYLEELVRGWLR